MTSYADTDDVIALRGPQNASVIEILPQILKTISAQFRVEARSYGKELDEMILNDEDLAEVTKCLVVDGAMQYLASSKSLDAPMVQYSQAGGGYSVSGTYLNPGGGLYTKKTWLKLLGVSRQKVGTIKMFGDCDEH